MVPELLTPHISRRVQLIHTLTERRMKCRLPVSAAFTHFLQSLFLQED